jgi:membrane-associated phospholipid phosphatase
VLRQPSGMTNAVAGEVGLLFTPSSTGRSATERAELEQQRTRPLGFLHSMALITPLAWAAFGLLAVVDLVWLSASPVKFATANFWIIGGVSLVLGLWLSIFRLVSHRLRNDPSRTAIVLRRAANLGALFLQALAFTFFFGWAGGTFICLATSAALPLQDAALASVDQMLGFDWLGFLALTNSNRIVSQTLIIAYHSAFPQMMLLYLLLSLSLQRRKLGEFLALFCITFAATCFVMLFVPAGGAYSYYRPQHELFDGFSSDAGMWHYEAFIMLRMEAAPVIELGHMKGLVTFPSFHTALAIITAYAFVGIRFIALPAAILNGIVIVSTLPEGGHFLVDVIAGAIIAVASIALVRLQLGPLSRGHNHPQCLRRAAGPTASPGGASPFLGDVCANRSVPRGRGVE